MAGKALGLLARGIAPDVFAVEYRHEEKIAPNALALGSFAHCALIDEAEALIEVAGAGVVLKDVEEEAMGVELVERDADELGEDFAAESALGGGDNDALELDRAGRLGESAEDGVSSQVAGAVFADEVACVRASEGGAMALFGPLPHESARSWRALQGENVGDIGGDGGADRHRKDILRDILAKAAGDERHPCWRGIGLWRVGMRIVFDLKKINLS